MGKPQYVQKFRNEWLSDPELKKWLIAKKNRDGETIAFCQHCNCDLNSTKLSDLRGHGKTKKHKDKARNMCGLVRQQ